jgi:hypothetical protein
MLLGRVFALRLGRTKPYWQPMGRRWEWERVVAKTTPPLPEGTAGTRIVVPWPKPEKRTLPSRACQSGYGSLIS